MTRTLTATYGNTTALANVVDELVNDGLERDKIYLDEDMRQVKVIIPDAIESGITEILRRHDPIALT